MAEQEIVVHQSCPCCEFVIERLRYSEYTIARLNGKIEDLEKKLDECKSSIKPKQNRYWVSWQDSRPELFCCEGPWWVSGNSDDGLLSMCAAVVASSEDEAKKVIVDAHDDKQEPASWRFCATRPDDWSPFCERFQRADWMRWP